MSRKSRNKRRRRERATTQGATATRPQQAQPRPTPQAGYHAVLDGPQRTVYSVDLRDEDKHLDTRQRKKLLGGARDQDRNFAIFKWMLDLHVAYVTQLGFQAKTEDAALNAELERQVEIWSSRRRFDLAQSHDRQSFFDLLERRALVDGDVFAAKLQTGHLQAIEGDRIATPRDYPARWRAPQYHWVSGIDVGSGGAPRNYMVCRRGSFEAKFDRVVPAGSILPHRYVTRVDQVRGVSPFSATLNALQDLYECFDADLAKQKLGAVLGVAITTDQVSASEIAHFGVTESAATGEEADDGAGSSTHEVVAHTIKPGKSVKLVELQPGQKVEVIESHHPSRESQAFAELMVKNCLLALGIPYIYYDSESGSYSVHRTEAIKYKKLCAPRIRRVRSLHDEWTAWRMILAGQSGEFELPSGWTLADVRWEWQPAGTPWIDPLKESRAATNDVQSGFTSVARVCKERGVDPYDVIDENARLLEYAAERGVSIFPGLAAVDPAAPPT